VFSHIIFVFCAIQMLVLLWGGAGILIALPFGSFRVSSVTEATPSAERMASSSEGCAQAEITFALRVKRHTTFIG
jgi:hypothetical protein